MACSFRIPFRIVTPMLLLQIGLFQIVAATQTTHRALLTLPSFVADNSEASKKKVAAVTADRKWWTQIGSRVYHAPDATSQLSGDIKDYYYAVGSSSALSPELEQYRVGGEDRFHVFHVPGGPSMLQTAASLYMGERRSSISKLKQLQQNAVLLSEFPSYHSTEGYKNPLSAEAQEVEQAAVSSITSDSFTAYLTNITSLESRSYTSPEASQKASLMVQTEFELVGLKPCMHEFENDGLRNVVAFIQGRKPGLVVVGAHYDSRPFTGAAPGAEDNGSGLAGLLLMAKAFMKSNIKPEQSVYFVGFAGEEGGMYGSQAFASALKQGFEGIPKDCQPKTSSASFLQKTHGGKENSNVTAIIMDEIGWVSPKLTKQTVNLEAYDWASGVMDHLVNACTDHNGNDLEIVHNSAPFGSDHMSFLDHDMAAVLTINGDDEAYPSYHQSSDTIEKVSADYATKIVKMNMGALLRMAGMQ